MSAPEQWTPVPDWPAYEVSDHGRVRRAAPSATNKTKVGRVLKGGADWRDGYPIVNLRSGNKACKLRIHQLVARAFIPRPAEAAKLEVAHNNGIRSDNRVTNLRWSTAEDNQADKNTHGTDNRGENHPNAKLTVTAVREIRRHVAEGVLTQDEIGKLFGVRNQTISRIAGFKRWQHVA